MGKAVSQEPLRRPGEIVFTIIILAFSATALWQAYRISGLTGLSTPGVFPMLATAAMLGSGFLRDALRKTASADTAREQLARFVRDVTPLRLVLLVAMILAYMLAMPWLGFTISSALFLFFAFTLLWKRGLLISLLVTALSLAVITGIFRVVFQVVLPQGQWVQGLF
jgi:hypothetical protein